MLIIGMGRRLHIQAQSGEVNETLDDGGEGIPASVDLVSSQILNTILSEGCKFGVGVTLNSQRSGKLDSDVLSQCVTQFILRIVSPVDQSCLGTAVNTPVFPENRPFRLDKPQLRSMIAARSRDRDSYRITSMRRQFDNGFAYTYFAPPPAAASRRVEA